ncbi:MULTISPECIES: hypothetical protein [unclassified Leucobacter]|uniref:hypothetical protein n=1 Tax=unclassified Leucobacter TaxID=2621730 RepID=UPI00165E68BB|nr:MULTISPECIES: hypothetical protein [unclassified Leucobacter]MBC9926905.1 hypothetical protein [Leucobacter sp. cx-169]MBC9935133.1 hypothetical protein [Leucobacter sp. cx-87]
MRTPGRTASVMEIPLLPPLQRSPLERQVVLFRTLIEIGQALGEFEPVFSSDEIARCPA